MNSICLLGNRPKVDSAVSHLLPIRGHLRQVEGFTKVD